MDGRTGTDFGITNATYGCAAKKMWTADGGGVRTLGVLYGSYADADVPTNGLQQLLMTEYFDGAKPDDRKRSRGRPRKTEAAHIYDDAGTTHQC